MQALVIVGWLLGVALAAMLGTTALIAFGLAVPAFLVFLAVPIAGIVAFLTAFLAAMLALIAIILVYLACYMIATAAIAPSIPAPTGNVVTTPTAVTVPAASGECFARGVMQGLTAGLNLMVLALVPVAGIFLGWWAFGLISLGTAGPVARNRVYQGFLGWAAWLFPMSYIATAIGAVLFVINFFFSFTALGWGAFRIDWTTGVVSSAGGLNTIFPNGTPFSLGNFVYLLTAPPPNGFTTPGTPAHETGHSLNTALAGGIVLWINAVDENLGNTPKQNLAYGELLAEGHSRAMPGTAIPDYAYPLWF